WSPGVEVELAVTTGNAHVAQGSVEQGEQAGIFGERQSALPRDRLGNPVPVTGGRDRPLTVGPEAGDLGLFACAGGAILRPQPLHLIESGRVRVTSQRRRAVWPELGSTAKDKTGHLRPVPGERPGERRRRRGPGPWLATGGGPG